MFQVTGSIDITPPLTWSEVKSTGFMVMNSAGYPVVPPGQYVRLTPTEELVDRAEGTLHKFTFDRIEASDVEIPDGSRETLRAQIAAMIAAFPTHTFGGANRNIRFRGDLIDDQWRIRLDTDGTVRRQQANFTWTDI